MPIDRHTTALLAMDFQNDIIHPSTRSGQNMREQMEETRALENTARAIAAARGKGLPVIHVAVAFRPGHPEIADRGPRLFTGIKKANILVAGTWGAAFHEAVQPLDGELVVVKRGVSALAGTELNPVLRARGISTLILAGIATTFVVEGTARDAADQGYQVVVLQDCCASFSREMHEASLRVLPQLATLSTAAEFARALGA